jgi:ATP-dependent exoDNAse (exonuclease V) beta subunit
LDQYHSEISLVFKTSRAAIFRREYLKEISKNITPLSLLSEISNEIENIKKERSLVLISDFNPTIAAEINNQPAPFIYERLGERYTNYFIDEFQDTSEMQWENIIPLIDYALSSEHPNNESAGLTLVGDAKQSIYRFRGGRAEQFISLYNTESQENPFNIRQNIINLPFNYRSAETIVEFNNSFFEFVSNKFENPTYKDLFESCGQVPKKTFSGYVNISFLEAENVQEEMELHPAKILEIIKDLEAGGMSKNDICVLTRTRKQSFGIANFLSENGISIVSSESLLISNSPEVLFINALFEFSVNSKDNNLKLEILNYLVQKLGVENPYQIISKNLQKDYTQIFEWLKDYQINFDLKQLQVLSLYEAAEYIIRCFTLIDGSNAYLQFYLDFVFENTTKNFGGISAFLEKWEQQKDKLSIVAPKTEHAVQVMTIHKSKGLEFPVVIYPFANTKLRDVAKDHLWLSLPEGLNDIPVGYFKASDKMLNWGTLEANAYNELLDQSEFDSVNVLYVAFTRASQQLYIISNLDLDKNQLEYENKVSGLLIGFLKYKNKWNENLSYEFGSKNLDNYKREESAKTIHQEHYYSSPTRSEVVNIVTKSGSLWDSLQEKAINKGLLVHNILSEIDTSEELATALEKFSEEEKLPGSQVEELEQLLSEVISHPKLARYFSASDIVYRERDIISPNGEILRPDRLNCNQNKVTVIDYKTGSVQPAHKAQMEQYATVLSQMGFEVSDKILVYINNEVSLTFV